MKTFLIIIFLFIVVGAVQGQQRNAQMDPALVKIKSDCRRLLLSDTAYATEQSYRFTDDVIYTTDAAGYFKSLSPAGSWQDIDYRSQMRGAWRPSWHLYRILLIVRAYYKNHDPAYLSAIHNSLRFWIKNDFKCENWWQNNINTPFAYASILLMLDKQATQDEFDYLRNVVTKRIPVYKATGQNLIWQLDNEARVALILNDYTQFSAAIKNMQAVIGISDKEGIQPDYSFHQHGAMLQFGNYGLHFANSLLFWMTVTSGTPVAFDKKKEKILFDYVSNGLRWSVYRGAMDITAVGRQIRENSGLKRGDDLYANSGLIHTFDPDYKCKYIMDGFSYPDESSCMLMGNKSFWRSDYMVQLQKDRYMMSVKMHGPFVKRVESINTENLKGAFLNDGVALIQRSGQEYRNIEPLWNWMMLPGTTMDTTLNPAAKPAFTSSNQSGFVGQISNGIEGISAMDYNRLTVKAKKSYFFADGMMIALGAGIESPQIANVVTTVDQRFYNEARPLASGKNADGQRWLWLDSTAYLFPDVKTRFKTKIEKRHSNWNTIDEASGDKPVSGTLFSVYITHNNDNGYVYVMKPGASLEETKQIAGKPSYKIQYNSADVQAIEINNKAMIVFYKAGHVSLSDKSVITADQPCMLICKSAVNGHHNVWISDPGRTLQTINVVIGKHLKTIRLPAGDHAGAPVEVEFR